MDPEPTSAVMFPAWTARLADTLTAAGDAVDQPAHALLARARGLERRQLVPAAVLAAIAITAAEGLALILTRRRDELPQHSGQVALPGGMIDPGDASPEAAALREAEEEIALPPARVQILGRLPRYPTGTGYLVTPVVGYVAELVPLTPAPTEVAEIFLLPVPVLLDPSNWVERELRVGTERVPHRELSYEGRRIWGVTANVLQLLVPPLKAAFHD